MPRLTAIDPATVEQHLAPGLVAALQTHRSVARRGRGVCARQTLQGIQAHAAVELGEQIPLLGHPVQLPEAGAGKQAAGNEQQQGRPGGGAEC